MYKGKRDNFSDADVIEICPYNAMAVAALEKLGLLAPSQDTIDVVENFLKDLTTEWGLALIEKKKT